MQKDKIKIYNKILKDLESKGIRVSSFDLDRPWGFFLVIDSESSLDVFIDTYYPELKEELSQTSLPLSPKILCVAPNKRLSWQYHHRRSELWKLINGQAGYIKSTNDEQAEIVKMKKNKILILAQGERHRLVGLEKWGIIAEIWSHTDPANPSDESDIVRLQDDFGR